MRFIYLKSVNDFSLKGFTLIELMVVIVILGLLAVMVMPKVMSYFGDSRTKSARLEIEIIAAALDEFKLDTGRYPTQDEGLDGLLQMSAEIHGWNGPYIKKPNQLLDPWSHTYRYQSSGSGTGYELISLGADNAAGGSGEDSDVMFRSGS